MPCAGNSLLLKIFKMKKLSLAFIFLASVLCVSANELSEAQQKAIANVERSMAIIDATWQKSIKGSSTNMYLADTYNTETGASSGPSDVWPYTAAIEAHNSLLEALGELKDIAPELYDEKFDYYKTHLDYLIDNLEYYRGTFHLSSYATNMQWSPFAVPRAVIRGTANVKGILNVYDDQMWLARELIRAYRITGNEAYLSEAAYLTDYVLDGWDCWRDEKGEEYGGITWGPGYNSKHACSNAPIIQPLVWLHTIYSSRDESIDYYYRDEENTVRVAPLQRSEHYLNFAKKVYAWQKDKLMHNSGVYWDMMGAVDGEIRVNRGYRQHVDCGGPVGNFYSYNTGTMLSGGAELYRVTGEESYKDDISATGVASLNRFSKYVRRLNTYEFTADATAREGFNTWFNDVLMRSYVDIYPLIDNVSAETGLKAFQTNLDYAFENHNRDNMLPIHLLDGWGDEVITKGFHQFAFASEYALLATWLITTEKSEGAVQAPVAAEQPESDEVYSLNGRHMGKLSNVKDSLSRSVYVVGSQKVLLGK